MDSFQPPQPTPSRTGLYIGIGAGLLVAFLIIAGVALAAVGIAAKRARDKEALAKFSEETQRIQSDFKADLNADADLSNPDVAKKADQAIDRMAAAAGSVDERMKVMVRTLMEEMVAIGKEASASTNRLMQAGGIDPSTLTSREEATRRLALFEKEKAVVDANYQRAKNLNQTARDTAARAGLPSKDTEGFIAGMNGQGKLDRIIRVREIDTLLYPEFIKLVTILRDNHGMWRVQDGQVTFSDLSSGLAERYNTLSESIGALSEEQANLIEQISNGN